MLARLSEGVNVLKRCERSRIVALFKPSLTLSHPNAGQSTRSLLRGCSYDHEEECYRSPDGEELWLCNRLDKGTSGVVMCSESKAAAEELKDLFRKREVEKQYVALCHGRIENFPKEKTWIDRVVVDRSKENELRVKKGGSLKTSKKPKGVVEASTKVKGVKQGYITIAEADVPILRVELAPHTGITHQLRYQLSTRGLPILHEELYSTRASQVLSKLMKAEGSSGHLMLHSASIQFPWKGSTFIASSCIPADMKVVLARAGIESE